MDPLRPQRSTKMTGDADTDQLNAEKWHKFNYNIAFVLCFLNLCFFVRSSKVKIENFIRLLSSLSANAIYFEIAWRYQGEVNIEYFGLWFLGAMET